VIERWWGKGGRKEGGVYSGAATDRVVAISVPGEGFGRAETRPERERAAIKV
jgi:hypothetical protein